MAFQEAGEKAQPQFLSALAGVTDPEIKRKTSQTGAHVRNWKERGFQLPFLIDLGLRLFCSKTSPPGIDLTEHLEYSLPDPSRLN